MAESTFVDKEDSKPQPEIFLSEREKQQKLKNEQYATTQRKRRLLRKQVHLIFTNTLNIV
jgi:hypothetical protein